MTPRGTGKFGNRNSTLVNYRDEPDKVTVLDAWARHNGMSRATAVRHIVHLFLIKEKYLTKG